jgi:hypothetical protein
MDNVATLFFNHADERRLGDALVSAGLVRLIVGCHRDRFAPAARQVFFLFAATCIAQDVGNWCRLGDASLSTGHALSSFALTIYDATWLLPPLLLTLRPCRSLLRVSSLVLMTHVFARRVLYSVSSSTKKEQS